MEELAQRLREAQQSPAALNRLVGDYLPFVKKEAARNTASVIEYEDRVSLGMLVFSSCVHQYDFSKGNFISFASVCIRNRLMDEEKKAARQWGRVVPLHPQAEEEGAAPDLEVQASIEQYSREREQELLAEEIRLVREELEKFNVSFEELTWHSPKQERSRCLCARLARRVVEDQALRAAFFRQRRLPQAQLAQAEGVSVKTVEKHRRYIVALAVILTGEYPGIRAFLPQCKEVEG